MTLLECYGERRESVLGGQTLVGPGGEEGPDHAVVTLLGRHVQRGEAVLRLHVHLRTAVHQQADHLALAWKKGGTVGNDRAKADGDFFIS